MTTVQLKKAARVILVGAPGVGKGTQSERLLARFPHLSSISSGDLLRENVRNKTSIGLKAERAMKAGDLVPDALILNLILTNLRSHGWLSTTASIDSLISASMSNPPRTTSAPKALETSTAPTASFILDGFPRTAHQARLLDRLIPINLVVHLITPASIIIDRIAKRWVHEPSGRVYNTDFNAPKVEGKDDVTGEKLTKRADDDEETWRVRLRKFEETSEPLLDHYDRLGVLWRVKGNSSDEISPKLFDEVERRFAAEEQV